MRCYLKTILFFTYLSMSGIAYSAEKFGMYVDSEWGVSLSHQTSGFAMGHCSEGFIVEISKGGGEIDLDITLNFIGNNPENTYTGNIETTLTGTTGGRSRKEYVESPDLCFKIKEVIIIKAIGTVDGKRRDLINEKKIFESGSKPLPISILENG